MGDDTSTPNTELSTSVVDALRRLPFKLLIVDDDANLRFLLRLVLTQELYTVYEAADGETALATCLAIKPDLILLDIALPDMDGIRVLQQIRQVDQTVRILMVSAFTTQKWRSAAATHGADEFIAKPFNVTTLLKTVARHLTRNRL